VQLCWRLGQLRFGLLSLGDFGSRDITIVQAYRVFTVASPLSYAVLDRPRPGQAAVLQDEGGVTTLVHLADTETDAQTCLTAHPGRGARVLPADAPEPRTFTHLQDPGHGWLILSRADLDFAGMSSVDFSRCSYVSGDSFAIEEDCDMPRFLKRLDERGIPYRLHERHTDGDAHVRCWACNAGPVAAAT
jgi:hypothetical protein